MEVGARLSGFFGLRGVEWDWLHAGDDKGLELGAKSRLRGVGWGWIVGKHCCGRVDGIYEDGRGKGVVVVSVSQDMALLVVVR